MLAQPRTLPNGSRQWIAPEVADFIDRLAEFDPSLALVKNQDGSWSIWRVAEDGREYVICRSKPGAALGPGLIHRLAEADTRRRNNNTVEKMIRHNEKVRKDAEDAAHERTLIALDEMLSKSWRGRVASNIEDLDIT